MTLRQRLALAAFAIVATLFAPATGAGTAGARDAPRAAISVAGAPACASASAAAGQSAHHAGLVIVFGDQRTETRCIEFTEDSISGVELLRRSGLPVVFSGYGGMGSGVCRIDDVGCRDPGDCFCQCRGSDCHYWTYFALENGAWSYENVGASLRQLRDGDVDAWVWGSGRDRPASARSPCPEAELEPTPTPQPASRGVSQPAATPRPTQASSVSGGAPPMTSAVGTPLATAAPTAVGTPQARRDDPVVGAGTGAQPDAGANGSPSSGPPAGLIAFAAVAGVLLTSIGVIAMRRRLRG